MDIYKLYRNFWDYAFNNPEKIKPNHVAIYSFAIEHCNRLGWKPKFGFPTSMVLEATGIKSYSVFKKTFDDLVAYGFIEAIEYSKNQYSSNIIALKENYKAHNKALDKAIIKHMTKQVESTIQSIDSIDKPITNKQLNKDISKTTLEDCEKLFLDKTAFNWTDSFARKEAEKFYNFYCSKGWKIGKDKMKSLSHAIGGWIGRVDKPETIGSSKSFEDLKIGEVFQPKINFF
jgi:hypothetical protein